MSLQTSSLTPKVSAYSVTLVRVIDVKLSGQCDNTLFLKREPGATL